MDECEMLTCRRLVGQRRRLLARDLVLGPQIWISHRLRRGPRVTERERKRDHDGSADKT
jgi:hypothetical protein